MKRVLLVVGVACAMVAACATMAKPGRSGAEVCAKMIADGRGGGLTQKNCVCAYRVAETVLDADLRALLFDSWYNGTDNSAALQALPQKGRVLRQMKSMKKTTEKTCPGFPAG
ncbi:MAG TPA: hypothetical protein PLH11_07770 [Gemmobacter sp.]|nr:hypothetical protein [Gemmobacter sp.]